MPAPPIPDQGTQQLLEQAYADARSSLKGQVPDSLLHSVPRNAGPDSDASSLSLRQAPGGIENGTAEQVDEPPPGAIPYGANDYKEVAEPPKGAEPIEEPSVGGFLKEEFRGTGDELLKAVPRFLLSLGKSVAFLGGGAAGATADTIKSAVTGKDSHEYADAAFDYIRDEIDSAANNMLGTKSDTGGAAQVIGGVAQIVPALALGGAGGAVVFATQAGSEAAQRSIDAGADAKTAAAIAVIAAGTAAGQMKMAWANPSIVKRIAAAAGANVALTEGSRWLASQILKSRGFQKAAKEYDPTDPDSLKESGLMGAIFGALAGKGVKPEAAPKPAETPPAAAPPPGPPGAGPAPPPPPTWAGKGVTSEGAPVTPIDPSRLGTGVGAMRIGVKGENLSATPPSDLQGAGHAPPAPEAVPPVKIPDHPSQEPLKDIQAQRAELDKGTRKGVYLTADNVKALGKEGVKALAGDKPATMNFDGKGGAMIFTSVGDRMRAGKAKAKLGAEGDMQALIGELTGAGKGKTADQTAVVQGHTPDGAVASESMVKPSEVAAKVEEVKAAGHEPVVTTPQEAVARREEVIAQEAKTPEADHNTPPPAAEAPKAEVIKRKAKTRINVKDLKPAEGVTQEAATEAAKPAEITAPKSAESAEKAPAAEAAKEPATVQEKPVSTNNGQAEKVDTVQTRGEAIPDLEKAAGNLRSSEGKKGKLADRAQNVSAFAHVLKAAAAKAFEGKTADEAAINRANEAANAAVRMGEKSTEEVAKGQGIGHAELAAHAQEMLAAADQLQGKSAAVKAPVSAVRAAKLKARAEKAKAAVETQRAEGAKAAAATPDETVMVRGQPKSMKEVVADARSRGTKPTFKDIGAELEVDAKDRRRVADAIKAAKKTRVSKAEADVGKVKSAIADTEDEVKAAKKAAAEKGPLRELSKDEHRDLDKKMEAYKIAGEGAAMYHRGRLEQALHELFKPNSAAEHEAITNLMTSAEHLRADWHGTAPRDLEGEVEKEVGDTGGIDYSDPDAGAHIGGDNGRGSSENLDMPAHAAVRAAYNHWYRLHDKLDHELMYAMMQINRHNEVPTTAHDNYSTHWLLDKMIRAGGPDNPVTQLLQTLRKNVPDMPVYPMASVRNPITGAVMPGVSGLHNPSHGIQIRLRLGDEANPFTSVTLVHEMLHAATQHFIDANPKHPLVTELKRMRKIAEVRLRAMHGDEKVSTYLDTIRGKMKANDARELNSARRFYGLTNIHEFITETLTNPDFARMLEESEKFAQPGENIPHGSILSRIFNVLSRMLGIKDPEQARLLAATANISQRIMEAQKAQEHKLFTSVPMGEEVAADPTHESLASLEHNLSDPEQDRRLVNEPRIAASIGRAATNVARRFYSAVRTGDIGKARRVVEPFKGFDQIVRDGLQWFGGRGDANNPLRQYHEATVAGEARSNAITERAQPLVERATKLSSKDSKQLGELMHDATIWGIDPTTPKDEHSKSTQNAPKFEQRYKDFTDRWENLTPEQQGLFKDVRDFNHWAAAKNRESAIDAALRTFTDKEVPPAERAKLYGVRSGKQFESMIGPGKGIDAGDRNPAMVRALETLAGGNRIEGPYFHLGRNGEYVVQITPEGSKQFGTRDEAETFARNIRDLSPESDAIISENPDGTHGVDYSADYVSMHETPAHAEEEAAGLRAKGFEVGNVTHKIQSRESAPLSQGAEQLISEATRKLNRSMGGEQAQPLVDALRTSFVQMMAQRSAYAGSRLMRKGTGGVKGEEWLRNFADHTQSLAWHTGQMHSVFAKGEALGKVRAAVKDPSLTMKTARGRDIGQHATYMRGEVLNELNHRLQQETAQYGKRSGFNAAIAKLGFANYLASPSHAFIWMTQNFTTTIPVAMSRWGGRAAGSMGASMGLVAGPAFREAILAHLKPGTHGATDITKAVIQAVRKSERFGKWAQGENSPLRQLMDRGAISTSFSNELATVGRGDNRLVNRVFEYARLLPHMADTFNRISTALTALEMTKGDVYQAADFVRETHMDYSGGNKPRAFKAVSRIPGFNSVTMFRTYTQGMAHLLYSNIKNMTTMDLPPGAKTRAESAKTVAGVMLATAVLAGVSKGMILEPARLAYYAWNKMFSDDDEYHDINHAIDAFMAEHLGKSVGEMVSRGVPRALGFDLSGRMGLADLFFHEPPDLLGSSWEKRAEFLASLLGPMPKYVSDQITGFQKRMQEGEIFEAIAGIVPIKMVQDGLKAGHLLVGKTDSHGARVVDPSVGAAATRFIGFKPSSEARSQEKQGVSIEYHEKVTTARKALVDRWVKGGYAGVSADIASFNHRNPAYAISAKDFVRERKMNVRTEAEVRGKVPRDPKLQKMLDY
jgi:hypothetical protein